MKFVLGQEVKSENNYHPHRPQPRPASVNSSLIASPRPSLLMDGREMETDREQSGYLREIARREFSRESHKLH